MYIRQLAKEDPIPYHLLLEADPSLKMIENYLDIHYTYVAESQKEIIAIYVLYPIDSSTIEIKNISVAPQHQGKGIGKQLLDHAETIAKGNGYSRLIIGTADVSTSPLKLYQHKGFIIFGKKENFILENYDEPVFDNGEQCIDMIMLEKMI